MAFLGLAVTIVLFSAIRLYSNHRAVKAAAHFCDQIALGSDLSQSVQAAKTSGIRYIEPLHQFYFQGWVAVPPHHASRTCPHCGHVAGDNRKTQSLFVQRCLCNLRHVERLSTMAGTSTTQYRTPRMAAYLIVDTLFHF
jgi:hypothetical protein